MCVHYFHQLHVLLREWRWLQLLLESDWPKSAIWSNKTSKSSSCLNSCYNNVTLFQLNITIISNGFKCTLEWHFNWFLQTLFKANKYESLKFQILLVIPLHDGVSTEKKPGLVSRETECFGLFKTTLVLVLFTTM